MTEAELRRCAAVILEVGAALRPGQRSSSTLRPPILEGERWVHD